jgi:hypothetical protein
MRVCDLMNPRVVTIPPKAPLREALQLMLRFHLNDVLIVDSELRLIGIVTYSDLNRRLLPTEEELMEHEEYLESPESLQRYCLHSSRSDHDEKSDYGVSRSRGAEGRSDHECQSYEAIAGCPGRPGDRHHQLYRHRMGFDEAIRRVHAGLT